MFQGVAAAPSVQPQADYSAQWAEYYRSLGMVKEAEGIEQQLREVANTSELLGHFLKVCPFNMTLTLQLRYNFNSKSVVSMI